MYAAVSTRWLDFFAWSIDEGMYVMRARMMAYGFGLYDEIWFNHPPLLVQAVHAAFAQFGERVEVARMVALGFACAGLVGVVIVTRELEGWAAGLAAGLLLIASPLFFSLSRAVMSTLPALSAAALSIGLLMMARRTGRRDLLVASGLAFGIGAAVKLIVAPLGIPVLIVLAGSAMFGEEPEGRARDDRFGALSTFLQRSILVRLGIWGIAAAIPLVAALAPYGPAVLFEQTIGSVVGARSAYGLDIVSNIQDLLEWLSEGHLGIAAIGAFGVTRGLATNPRWRIVGVWLAVSLGSVLFQTPLWSHHFVLLVFPLAIGAGAGAVWAIEGAAAAWKSWRTPDSDSAEGWSTFGAVSLVLLLLVFPVVVKRNAESTRSDSEDPWRAISAVQEITEPGDFVVTDSPMIAFRAGLNVPPNLCDPGAKRFASGSLSLPDVADDVVRYSPTAVVTWNGRFARSGRQTLPQWLTDQGWREVATLDAGRARRIYAPDGPPGSSEAIDVGATWSSGVRLESAEIVPHDVQPGGRLSVVLQWLAAGPTTNPLTVFTHLESADGERVAQQDNPPGRGVRATDHWITGETIRDVYELDLPPTLVPGEYRLRIGLYDSETGEGWPLDNGPATVHVEGNTIVIEPVMLSEPSVN